MARFVGAALLLIFPLLVFNIAGLGGSGYLFDTLNIDDPPTFLARNPVLTLIVSLTLITTTGAIIAGAFLGRSLDTILANAALFALLGVMIGIITDYIFIYNTVKDVSQGFATLILAPILLATLFFIVEFIMRKD